MLDLNKIEQYRENNRIEAKLAQGGFPHSVWETYSAFANTLGGIILLGVKELKDKSFECVELPSPEALAEEFMQVASDKRLVSVNLLSDKSINIVEHKGHRIVTVEIPQAQRRQKPVFVYGDFTHGAYRRGGEGDYRCSPEQIRSMIRDRADIGADRRIIESLPIDCIDPTCVRRYRRLLYKADSDVLWQNLNDIDFLYRIEAIALGSDSMPHPTCAGLLMFGNPKSISGIFPQYGIFLRTFDNDGINYTDNLFNSFFAIYERLCRQVGNDDSLKKTVYEGLINSVIHADYLSGSNIGIISGGGSIVISNPGNMRVSYDTFSPESRTEKRNPVLSNMFVLIKAAHDCGHGFELMHKQNGVRLFDKFDPDRTVFSMYYDNGSGGKIFNKTENNIIDFLTDNISCSAYEIAIVFNLTLEFAQICLDKLVKNDIVVFNKNINKYVLKS